MAISPISDEVARASPYVPQALRALVADNPTHRVCAVDGTSVFVDVTGFTTLAERLARRGGREGAEQLADAIGRCFERLLAVAYAEGASLLKFGGDALLLLFHGAGHTERACASAIAMSRELRAHGTVVMGATRARLRMSAGVHSGEHLLFAIGQSHRELVVAGPAATEVLRLEKAAGAGEVALSPVTAGLLADRCLGPRRGTGRLLRSVPAVPRRVPPPVAEPGAASLHALSTELRAHVLAGPQAPEHRIVTVAFLRFEGTDALVAERGPDGAAALLEDLVTRVQLAADEQQLCFLGSDIDVDGGKLILTAGAPRALGDEDERMLLALRRVMDGAPPLPVRIGVARGPCFAGDIGPSYRRTYTVMGDVVNLAARLMAKAPPGRIYSAPEVLERSSTRFETAQLDPFRVKGMAQPVRAVSVGRVRPSDDLRDGVPVRFPLIGREPELDAIVRALDDASRGRGRLIELVSEPGMGRSRLMEEVRDRAEEMRMLRATCTAYTSATPYRAWRDLLRQVLGVAVDASDDVVRDVLRATLERDDPSLLRWLPLLAAVVGVEAPPTPDVEQLAPQFRPVRLHEVVLRFLRRQLGGWTLIELAEAHLMDAASADLLHALAGELPLLPWLVVVSRRDRDTGFTAAPAAHVVHLELPPLRPADTLALAEAVTEGMRLPPHLVTTAAERSGGNPQFLRDLLRAMASGSTELPDSIETAAQARLDRLPPADRALIRRASVLGLRFRPSDLDELLVDGLPKPTADTWARLTLYFAEEDGGLRFRREVVRDVAYAGLPFSVRRELHDAAARRLERVLGADAEDESAQLSLHFHHAGHHAKAWRYGRVAADRARRQSAFADAATLYRRALESMRQLDVSAEEAAAVWESLADAYVRTGELERADRALGMARRLSGGDALRTAHLLWLHARIAERAGQVVRAVRWSRRALRLLDRDDSGAAAACRSHVVATLAAVRQRQGRTAEAIRLARRAIADAEAAGEELALGHACQILDWALVESGHHAEAVHSARALEIFRRHGAADRESAVLNNMGGFAYLAGRWEEAVSLYQRAADASRRAGDVNFGAFSDCNVGELLSDQGRLDEAEPLLRRALQVWRGTEDVHGVAFGTALLGRLHARAGRPAQAAELLEAALAGFRALRADADAAHAAGLLAEAALFAGRPGEARDRALAILPDVPADARVEPLLRYLVGVAMAQLGEPDAAVGVLEEALEAARRCELSFETVLALDALVALAGSSARRRERDRLIAQLHIVRLPAPPIARPLVVAVSGTADRPTRPARRT